MILVHPAHSGYLNEQPLGMGLIEHHLVMGREREGEPLCILQSHCIVTSAPGLGILPLFSSLVGTGCTWCTSYLLEAMKVCVNGGYAYLYPSPAL